MDPSSNLERTYAYISRKVNLQNILTGDFTAFEFVAMIVCQNKLPQQQASIVTSPSLSTSSSFDMGIKQSRSSRYCTYCGEKRHTKS
ncbi:hypothetical protein SADUNF_Sadunf01G0121900 [Salix dunnii]|uniref:Uncharacterized protein n=1 Tax=Salix dunnii TaxID=1413687 RepID=A0A835NBF4_9ROSI|nr:hypothetical protein SADUNF_Sadunf01G0121900 [Salix dunnii]